MYMHRFGSFFGDFNAFVTRQRKGDKINVVPNPKNGLLGSFQKGDRLTITITVTLNLDHECFTLDTKRIKTPRKSIGIGLYEKTLTVIKTDNHGLQVAPWPANMLGLVVGSRIYNVGIFNQKGLFYLAAEEYKDDPDRAFSMGEVKWFSLLRGVGSVSSGDSIFFDRRIHWTNTPLRNNGLRYLNTGEILEILKVAITDSSTSFRQEITKSHLKK